MTGTPLRVKATRWRHRRAKPWISREGDGLATEEGDAGLTTHTILLRESRSMRETRARLLRWVAPVAIAALLAISACSDQTGPSDPGNDQTPSTQRLQDPVGLAAMIADARERILPTLPEGCERNDLAVSLQRLAASLEVGTVAPVRSPLALARIYDARYAAKVRDDEVAVAQVVAIRLALEAIEDAIAAASAP